MTAPKVADRLDASLSVTELMKKYKCPHADAKSYQNKIAQHYPAKVASIKRETRINRLCQLLEATEYKYPGILKLSINNSMKYVATRFRISVNPVTRVRSYLQELSKLTNLTQLELASRMKS